MRAGRVIERGEEIVSEQPILVLEVGLTDIYRDELWDDRKQQNILAAFRRAEKALSQPDRTRFNNLYNRFGARSGAIGTIRTSAFAEEDVRRGQKYKVFLVYDIISRVNHSCGPNAEVHWNPENNTGSLRAVRQIANQDEIRVTYLGIGESIGTRTQRSRTLRKIFDFDCNCTLCNIPDPRADNTLRLEARRRFDRLETRVNPNEHDRQTNNRLEAANSLVGFLRQLNIFDGRLAWAYNQVPDLHFRLFENARDAQAPNGDVHDFACPCHQRGGPEWHLHKSAKAWHAWFAFDKVTHAHDHPVIARHMVRVHDVASELPGAM